MLTIDLEPELETTLNAMAQKEHSSPSEIIKQLINRYIKEKQESGLLIDIVKDLPEIACFKDNDPLATQRAIRDENSIKNLKGIVPKPEKAISLDEMKQAIELEGAKR